MQGGLSRHFDASLVIRQNFSGFDPRVLLELFSDLVHHLEGGFSHRFDAEGGEGVWQHGSDEKSSEDQRVDDVDVAYWVQVLSGTGSGEESAEERQTHERSAADGETFSDSGGCVSSGVQGVGSGSDGWVHLAHFSETSGVVAHRTVGIDG